MVTWKGIITKLSLVIYKELDLISHGDFKKENQVVNPTYSQHLQCDPEIELQKQTTCEVETILHNLEPEITHI